MATFSGGKGMEMTATVNQQAAPEPEQYERGEWGKETERARRAVRFSLEIFSRLRQQGMLSPGHAEEAG
jgi:hypothetical protein